MWDPWYSSWLKWQVRSPRGSARAYAIAIGLVAVATIVRWGLGFLGDSLLPFTAYYPAVLFATFIGGAPAGIAAAILGGIVGSFAFFPPSWKLLPLPPGGGLELTIYVVTSALIIWGADSYRRLAIRVQSEETLRKLAVDELAHRLKNKIASIQSIVSYQLREHPELRDDISARLIALAAADDLIMAAQGRGAHLGAVLSAELTPYGLARTTMQGPDVLLTPTLALTMALLIHELATNAAKYGALSVPTGTVAVTWTITGNLLKLHWQELGGPPVAPPSGRGFGLQLLSRALEPFGGCVEPRFEPTGLACSMSAVLPEPSASGGVRGTSSLAS
jgi:two-component sensor histidine kinase